MLMCACVFCAEISPAQSANESARDSSSFYDMSLEDLMKIEVTVASSKALSSRESPGILTVITEEEIRKSGATDLMELLGKVPGFDFGVDVEGVVGIGVRGNWAHEGKVLMLLDGHELNEELFSAIAMGGHYSTSQIKQIEIIRGPGSSIYGGNAEYAVINIISKQSSGGNGITISSTYGQMSRQFATRNVAVAVAKPIGAVHLGFSALLSQANRSQEDFTDNYGATYNMANESGINTTQYKMDITWKKLKISGFSDQYHLHQRDGYENNFSRSYPTYFDSYHFLAEYELPLSKKITLTPVIKYKNQQPWKFDGESEGDEFTPYKVSAENILGLLKMNYEINESMNLLTGIETVGQRATRLLDSSYFENGNRTYSMNNQSVFSELMVRKKIANLTIGARYNQNDRFANAFVPRMGLTRVFNKWHFKLLYSSAFRSPSIENINLGIGIKPERTNVMELELGYKLGANSYLTANVFDIVTKDAIIFYYDTDNEDAYKNEGMAGTRGVEFEYRVKTAVGYMNLNYSYSTSNGKQTNERYSVPGHKGVQIGFPTNKISMLSNIRLSNSINASPSLNWMDKRYDIYTDDQTGEDHVRTFKQALYLDAMFNFEKVFIPGLVLQVGCINILDTKTFYIQPYNSNHAALPGTSREYRLKINYTLNFHKK